MIVNQESDESFSIFDDDKHVLKTGIISNAEAWRLADKMDAEAVEDDERHSRITVAFHNK